MGHWPAGPVSETLSPFIATLNGIGNGIVRLIGLEPVGGHGAVHSVEELSLLVHSTREAGLLAEQQEQMVAGVFDFGERRARPGDDPAHRDRCGAGHH